MRTLRILLELTFFCLLFKFGQCIAKADSLSIYFENDCLISDDSDYTHGTKITYMFDNNLWPFDRYGLAITQNMYTPSHIDWDTLQTNDRPYCGLLGLSFIGEKYKGAYLSDQYAFMLGLTGDLSLAGKTQTLIHKILGCRKPSGWQYQIDNEVVFNMEFKRNILVDSYELFDGLFLNLADNIHADVGTWKDSFGFSCDLILSNDKRGNIDYGITERVAKQPKPNYWILLGTGLDVVLHSMQFDGSLFRHNQHTVDSELLVVELHYGIGCKYHSTTMQLINIYRTDEYHNQVRDNKFSTFLVTIDF